MLIAVDPNNLEHVDFLYQLLIERYEHAEIINVHGISLPELPSYESHVMWMRKNTRGNHWIWTVNGRMLAMVSLRTDENCDIALKNEAGIFVLKKYWGTGVGPKAWKALIDMHPGENLYGKVNPHNERSERLAAKLGFKQVANIWRRDGQRV